MNDVARGWLFDGVSAVRHDVDVSAAGGVIEIAGERVVPAEIDRVAGTAAHVYSRRGHPGWRLGFDVVPPTAIGALLPQPQRYGKWIDRAGLWKAGAAFALVSALTVAVVLNAPGWIGPYVPYTWEQKMGSAMIGDLGGRFCKGAGGQAALDSLVRRIDSGGEAVRVRVIHFQLINAVTLPGGTILIFDGLLKQAKSPDELAGILGHEIGHVRHRDAMQALVRQLGLSALLGGLNSSIGNNLNVLLSARYSRKAESAADDYAIATLRRTHVAPGDTAAFFARIGRNEGPLGGADSALAYIASHPVSSERQAHFAHSAKAGEAYSPALDTRAWRALADICRNDPSRRNDEAFDPFH